MLLVLKQHRCSSHRGSDLLQLWMPLSLKALGFKALCRISFGFWITQRQTGPGSTGKAQVHNPIPARKALFASIRNIYFSMLRKKENQTDFHISNSANWCGFTVYGCRKSTGLLANFAAGERNTNKNRFNIWHSSAPACVCDCWSRPHSWRRPRRHQP